MLPPHHHDINPSGIIWWRKSDDLSSKSCIFTSKQLCANTMIRLLATQSWLSDTENVKHSKHFKSLSTCVDDEYETPDKPYRGPATGISRKKRLAQAA